ncbi:hypothetical protein [Anaeromicropila populeti]|uniref:Uncharacterized protein n=1 Tax=Anaeromicropila populeti TaxID=37658 RepID=A0A1I6LX20_9FIRM|nr:hypothetical protein [Anaeromicropila populeti]SFS07832.1 hypothetical protein SAMN05661086_03621 [Anaeromicropila populeti]
MVGLKENTKKMDLIEVYEAHKATYENWKEGDIAEYWFEEEGILCIEYESGNWWHYKYTNEGLQWW